MKLQELAKEIFEKAQQYEQKPDTVNFPSLCLNWGLQVKDDPSIKGAFNYSDNDPKMPITAIFHQDSTCLCFFFSNIEKQKFFVSFSDEKLKINRMKQIERSVPVKMESQQMQSPMIDIKPYKPLSLPSRPVGYFETPLLKPIKETPILGMMRGAEEASKGLAFETPLLKTQFVPRSLPEAKLKVAPLKERACNCPDCIAKAKGRSKSGIKAKIPMKRTERKGRAKESKRK